MPVNASGLAGVVSIDSTTATHEELGSDRVLVCCADACALSVRLPTQLVCSPASALSPGSGSVSEHAMHNT